MLVILDNLEQVIGVASFIARLLDAGPEIRLLATSRQPVRIEAEQLLPLHPFTTETPETNSDAIMLFIERARSVDPAFALNDANAGDVAAICRSLDGLPLAIELAAARTRILSPAAMRARLALTPLDPGAGRRDAPERQQTLSNAIDWSYRLLAGDERRLIRVLSVFAGSFTLEMGDALWRGENGGAPTADFVEGVSSLADHSLLGRAPGPFGDRFAMLQTIRSFAQRKLAATDESSEVRDRHAGLIADFVESIEKPDFGSVPTGVIEREHVEIDNIRAALTWSVERPDASTFFRLVSLLGRYWIARGGILEAKHWIDRAVARLDEAALENRIRVVTMASWIASFRGDYDVGMDYGGRALELANELGDVQQQVNVLNANGAVALHRGDIQLAINLYEDAVDRATLSDRPIRHIGVYHNLSLAYLYLGDTVKSQELQERTIQAARDSDDLDLVVYSTFLLVEIKIAAGRVDEAAAVFERVLPEAMKSADHSSFVGVIGIAASLAAALGRFELSAILSGAARALGSRLGFAYPPVNDIIDRQQREDVRAALGAERMQRSIAAGAVLSTEEVIELMQSLKPSAETPTANPHGLTARERDVLRLLGEGGTNAEIGERLFISARTVQTHVANILAKLGASSRAAAVGIAAREGLL